MQRISKLWFSFQGRASRREFWGFYFVPAIVALLSAYVVDVLLNARGLLFVLCQLLLLWPSFAVGVKRFHDRGLAGRPFVFLQCALLALLVVGTVASVPVGLATVAHVQPSSFYVGVMFAATIASLLLGIYLLAVLGFRKGEAGPNRYGPDPLQDATA
jgi:uncharacterized membrane protein YhaH (DUF805 family)